MPHIGAAKPLRTDFLSKLVRTGSDFAKTSFEEATFAFITDEAEGEFVALGCFAVRSEASEHVSARRRQQMIPVEFARIGEFVD